MHDQNLRALWRVAFPLACRCSIELGGQEISAEQVKFQAGSARSTRRFRGWQQCGDTSDLLTWSCLATGAMASLNLSIMVMKILPLVGSFWPAAMAALANALLKSVSMPITSPVERISGPSNVSAPAGNQSSVFQSPVALSCAYFVP